jgi:hypothetical protein
MYVTRQFQLPDVLLLSSDGMSTGVECHCLVRVLLRYLFVQFCIEPGEGESVRNVAAFKALLDFLLEYDQFILHLRIDVSLVISRPEAPKSITDNVTEASFLLFTKYVLSELG